MHISPNGKKYVGITNQSPEERWRGGKGYCRNEYFYRAILKYGWDNFQHIVLMSGLSEEEANLEEERLIRELDLTNPQKGYNLHTGGLHHKVSNATREKMSKSQTGKFAGEKNPFYGKTHSEEVLQKFRKRVECYSLKGEYLRSFESIKAASQFCKCDNSGIAKACKKENSQYAGYQWKYEDSEKIIVAFKRKAWNAKKVLMIDRKTNEVIKVYNSATELNAVFGKNARLCISDCCNGKQKTAYGYVWKYE